MNKPNWSLHTWYCILTMKMQQLGTECWHWLEDLHKFPGVSLSPPNVPFSEPTHRFNPYSHSYRNQEDVSLSSAVANFTMIHVSKGECRWVEGVWSSQAVSFLCLLPISSPGTVQWPIQHSTYLTYDTKADMQTINFILAYEWWISSRTLSVEFPYILHYHADDFSVNLEIMLQHWRQTQQFLCNFSILPRRLHCQNLGNSLNNPHCENLKT